MRNHWKYLLYVLKHKWFVFLEGLKIGVPLWRLLIHDWQKFTPTEWGPYVDYFWRYPGKDKPPAVREAFDRAWHHHQALGPHHWQYWLLVYDDQDEVKTIKMPASYMREMLADWRGAGRAITGKDDTRNWYLKRRIEAQLGVE
jgi:hypothetical protein